MIYSTKYILQPEMVIPLTLMRPFLVVLIWSAATYSIGWVLTIRTLHEEVHEVEGLKEFLHLPHQIFILWLSLFCISLAYVVSKVEVFNRAKVILINCPFFENLLPFVCWTQLIKASMKIQLSFVFLQITIDSCNNFIEIIYLCSVNIFR